MQNANAIATVETMQNVVGAPVISLAQTQKLDYLENIDQSRILKGILGGIMQNHSVLLDIKDAQNIQTQETIQSNKIAKEEDRKISDKSGETNLEDKTETDKVPMMERLGKITKMMGTKISSFSKGISGFFAGKGPLILLAGAFFLLRTQLDTMIKAFTPIIETIRDKVIPPLINLYENIIKPFVTTIIEGLGKSLPSVFEGLGSIIQGIVDIFSGDIIKGLKNIFGGFGNILKGAADFILNFFGTSTDEIGASVSQLFTDIMEGIKAPFIAVYDFLKTGGTADKFLQDSVYAPIDRFFEGVKQFFVDLWDGAINAVKNTFKGVSDFFSGIVDKIKNVINGVIDSLPLPDFIKNKLRLDTKESEEADAKKNEFIQKANIEYSANRMAPEEQSKIMNKLYPSDTPKSTSSDTPKSTRDSKGRSAIERFKDNQKEIALQRAQPGAEEFRASQNDINPEALKRQEALSKFKEEDYIKASELEYGSSIDPSELTDRQKFKFMRSGKSVNPEDDQMDQVLTPKRKTTIPSLDRDTAGGGASIVNAPVNSSSVVNNNQPTISFTKMDTGVDPYTEKMQNSF
jgi:hypothetical protein